jgi:quercetin dioxygenase-like cupin family protein
MFSGLKRGVSLRTLALAAIGCLAAGWGLGTAVGQMTPPMQDSGVISRKAAPVMDLGPDLPGYQLRLSVVTFEPGAVRAFHDHRTNPEINYILEGKVTEHSKDGTAKDYGAGDMRANGRDVEHWLENRGSSKFVQVVATVVKAK